MINQFKTWLSPFQRWFISGLLALVLCITLLASSVIFYATEGTKATQQRIYESSLWNTLQFQLQSYRFINYLIQIKPSDFPLKGSAYNEYDLLMSRLDLMRNGDVGYLIRGITGGRTVRLLNIITGELELISLNLTKIENGDISYLDEMINRLHRLDKQVNELTVLVSRDTNKYIATQRRHLGDNLVRIQWLMGGFLISLCCLFVCIIKGYQRYKKTLTANHILRQRVLNIHEEKANMLGMMEQEVRPAIQTLSTLSEKIIQTDEQQAKELLSNHIKDSGQQLITTLNIFTDLALLEAQKLKFKAKTGDIESYLEACAQTLSPQILRKGICLATYVDPFIQNEISLDFKRFNEILLALLQNAITYTPKGGTISVHIRPSNIAALKQNTPEDIQSIQMMRIVVQDNGIGMPASLQNALRTKSPLAPVEEETSLQYEVGLGLAFCYKLVDFIKGEIHFTSEPHIGTEFWIDIPYFVPIEAKKLSHSLPQQTIHRALLLEKDPILTNTLTLQLAKMNIEAMLYDPQYFQSDDDFDLIIMTQISHFSQDMESSVQQWQSNNKIIFYDSQLSTQDKLHIPSGHPLPAMLTQSKLHSLITTVS